MTGELSFESLEQKRGLLSRLRGKARRNVWLLWAFCIPAFSLLAIHFMLKVYPVGNNSVLVLDLNAQYVYFYEELRDLLRGDGSILYSWQRSLGGEFMGIFAYYVASPFNFIVALFPEGHITEALLTIFVLKAGLSGFNFALFLKLTGRMKSKISAVTFSTMYALCAYAVVNSHNSMWIDAFLFLPLLITGLEKLINERKFILYTSMLAVIAIANFYIGYMVCIFVFIYSIYYYLSFGRLKEHNLFREKFHFLKSFGRVLFFSVLAIAISAVVVMSAYYSLTFGKTEFSNPNYEWKSKFDLFNMFGKFLPGSYDTVRPEGLPFVYCGALALVLLPLYFMNTKIDYREKLGTLAVTGILTISFNVSPIDMFWHGLQNPNWLNYRYAFLLVFMLVTMAHHAYEELDGVSIPLIVGTGGVCGLLTVLLQKFDLDYVKPFKTVMFGVIAIVIYTVALCFVKRSKAKDLVAVIVAIIVSTEMLVSSLITMTDLDTDVVISTRDSYRTYIDKYTEPIANIKAQDDGFYRMEVSTHRKPNDNMALDLNGLTSSTSTLNASVVKLLNQFGYASKSHWSKYLGGMPVSDSLLDIKYVFYNTNYKGNVYEKLYDDGKIATYRNPYALSVAYSVSNRTEYFDFEEDASPFEMFNQLVSTMIGGKYYELFKPVNLTETYTNVKRTYATSDYLKYVPIDTSEKATIDFKFIVPTNDELFLFFPSAYPREVSLDFDKKNIGTFFGNETDRIVSLGQCVSGEEATLSVTLNKENFYVLADEFFVYYLDTELFREAMSMLKDGVFNVTEHSDTRLYGDITVDKDGQMIFTSIPYDEGWHIYVDGKEASKFLIGGSLIGFDIEKGSHELEFKYMPRMFVQGAIITSVALLCFVLLVIFELKYGRKNKQKLLLKLREADEAAAIAAREADETDETDETEVFDETDVPDGSDAPDDTDGSLLDNSDVPEDGSEKSGLSAEK